jgi:hypothetical protein
MKRRKNSKLQRSAKLQTSKNGAGFCLDVEGSLELGCWCLEFIAALGAWNLELLHVFLRLPVQELPL